MQGTMQRAFSAYGEHRGPLGDTRKGVIVNLAPGTVTAYAVEDLASRGTFFVKPGTEVYAGMVVGECNKAGMDLEVNMTKEKSSAEVYQRPIPPRLMSLEDMLGFMAQDELLEVTPGAVRLRKAILDSGLRKRKQKQEESMGLA